MLSAGPIASLFSYCPFYSQMGMQFWLLIGAFEGVAQGEGNRAVSGCWNDRGILWGSRIRRCHQFLRRH